MEEFPLFSSLLPGREVVCPRFSMPSDALGYPQMSSDALRYPQTPSDTLRRPHSPFLTHSFFLLLPFCVSTSVDICIPYFACLALLLKHCLGDCFCLFVFKKMEFHDIVQSAQTPGAKGTRYFSWLSPFLQSSKNPWQRRDISESRNYLTGFILLFSFNCLLPSFTLYWSNTNYGTNWNAPSIGLIGPWALGLSGLSFWLS